MMRLWVALGLAVLAFGASTASAQIFVQLDCRLVVNRDDDRVLVYGLMRSTQPAKADYSLEVLKIDADGSGATEQRGKADLLPGDVIRTGAAQFNLTEGGWIEFTLTVTERLTGQTCEAKDAVLPL